MTPPTHTSSSQFDKIREKYSKFYTLRSSYNRFGSDDNLSTAPLPLTKEESQLLQTIKCYPELYDRKSRTANTGKNQVYKALGRALEMESDVAMRKWRQLRVKMTKYVKWKAALPSSSNVKFPSDDEYEKHAWIFPFVRARGGSSLRVARITSGGSTSELNAPATPGNLSSRVAEWVANSRRHSTLRSEPVTCSGSEKAASKRKPPTTAAESSVETEILSYLASKRQKLKAAEDTDRIIANSLYLYFRKIPVDLKLKAQMEVQQYLMTNYIVARPAESAQQQQQQITAENITDDEFAQLGTNLHFSRPE